MENKTLLNSLKKNRKGQSTILFNVLVGFVFIASVMVLLVLLIYTFGTVYEGLESTAISNTVTNETGGWINATPYPLNGFDSTGQPRSFSITQAGNTTYPIILSSNYTVDPVAGTITGSASRTFNYTSVNVSYTYLNNSPSQTASRDAQNDTTTAIPLVGILFIILAVGALITILIVSLTGRRRS